MQKIVINDDYGGFGLSRKAVMRYAEIKKIKLYYKIGKYGTEHYSTKPIKDVDKIKNKDYFSDYEIKRDDPALIQVVEELKEEANGDCANLKIVAIPNSVAWEIEGYDGAEWVSEQHRTWT